MVDAFTIGIAVLLMFLGVYWVILSALEEERRQARKRRKR